MEVEGDCSFPNVRKAFWTRSHSAPPSPNLPPSSSSSSSSSSISSSSSSSLSSSPLPPLLKPLPPLPKPPPLTEGSVSSSSSSSSSFSSSTSFRAGKARTGVPPLSICRRSLEEWPGVASDDSGVAMAPSASTPGRGSRPDMKLDLGSVLRAPPEPTEIQLKRDKFAFFDKECSRIADHLYLGSDAVAKNLQTLKANAITHVLNCVGFVCPEYFRAEFSYKTLWLQDSPCEDITSLLYDVFDYFEEVREQGGRVFVHCCQGVSRSTSLVIAYLMWRDGRSFEDAFQDVKAARGVTNPNMGFACQLLQCQKRVHAAPMSPETVLRVYRLAPHSAYDPLHLVPKAVVGGGGALLDSRGAFVVHLPRAIYVWVGRMCPPRVGEAARGAASQVLRYERADGPVLICSDGSEPPEFRKSFSTLGKQVPSYDADFELYEIASRGGVFPPVPSSSSLIGSAPARVPIRDDGWTRLRRKLPWITGLITAKPLPLTPSPNLSMSSSSPHFSVPSSPLPSSSPPSEEPLLQHQPLFALYPSSLREKQKNGHRSLAERRGSVSPSLTLTSLKLSSEPQHMDYYYSVDGRDDEFGFFGVNEDETMEDVELTEPPLISRRCRLQALHESELPVLYEWPSFEKIAMFDAEDLDSISIFVLVAANARDPDRCHEYAIYVWQGSNWVADKEEEGKKTAGGDWASIEHTLSKRLPSIKGCPVKVVRQGEEPDEFWEHFIHG